MDKIYQNKIWRQLEINGAIYYVSQDGQVASANYRRTGRFHVLSPVKAGKGYPACCIGGKMHYVHRLVALAFPEICGRPDGSKTQVNHINEVKTDNRAENLEWISASGNVKWSFDLHRAEHEERRLEKLRLRKLKLQEERAAKKAARLAKREAKKQKEAEKKAAAKAKRDLKRAKKEICSLERRIELWKSHLDKLNQTKYTEKICKEQRNHIQKKLQILEAKKKLAVSVINRIDAVTKV